MTGKELKSALKAIGWTQAELGRQIEMAPHSVGRWIADRDAEVPGPVAAYVKLAMKIRAIWKDLDSGDL